LAGLSGLILPGVSSVLSTAVTPLLLGAVGCCLAAAVHGRDVSVKDTWNFISKRYGAVLLAYILSFLVVFLISIGAIILIGLVSFAAIYFFSSQAASASDIGTILAFVGIIAVSLVAMVFFSWLFAWMGMAPLALCLEGDGRDNSRCLRRTYELMRGNWWRIFGLVSLVGLAILALVLIMMGLASLIIGLGTLKEVTSGQISPESITKLTAGYVGSFSLISILWAPFYYLALGVQYLDLRVRKEALDLEWAAQDKHAELA
jgi:hypothetical protein